MPQGERWRRTPEEIERFDAAQKRINAILAQVKRESEIAEALAQESANKFVTTPFHL